MKPDILRTVWGGECDFNLTTSREILHMQPYAKNTTQHAKSRVFATLARAYPAQVIEYRRSGQKSKVHDHTLSGKKKLE